MGKSPNEILMEEYEAERREKAEEAQERKAKKIKRRNQRKNRHAWGSEEVED